jgi:hypothetical protein
MAATGHSAPCRKNNKEESGVRYVEMEGTKRCESTRKQGRGRPGWGVDTFVRD